MPDINKPEMSMERGGIMNCSSHAVLQSGSQFQVYLPASLVGSQESGIQDCCHVDKVSCRQLITAVTCMLLARLPWSVFFQVDPSCTIWCNHLNYIDLNI
jgi:hypothetical protein